MGRSPLRKEEDLVTGAHDPSTLTAIRRIRQAHYGVTVIRRSFRIGLWLGLLAGIGFAVAKLMRSKPSPAVIDLGSPGAPLAKSPTAWPPLEAPVPTPAPVAVAEPSIEPVVAADEPGLVTIGDEPLKAEPLPTVPAPPQPVASAPAPPAPAKPVKKVPATKKAAAKKAPAKKKLPPWVDPEGNICPKTHPIKGKLSSMIFQAPGNFAYDRTNPDRCYESATTAEKDGLRPAKR